MYSSGELFMHSLEGYFGVLFSELHSNERSKHQDNSWVSVETVRHKSTYIVLVLTRYQKSINDDKNDDLLTSTQWLTHESHNATRVRESDI